MGVFDLEELNKNTQSIDPKTGLAGGNLSDDLVDDLSNKSTVFDLKELNNLKLDDESENIQQDDFSNPLTDFSGYLDRETFGTKNLNQLGRSEDWLEDTQEIFEGGNQNLFNQNIDEELAQAQSGWRLFGNSLAQSTSEIVLGGLEGFGYLADIPMMANILTGKPPEDGDFGNWWSDFFKTGKEHISQEAFNVYLTEEGKGFAPGDATWWASNAPSIVSSVSMAIPGFAAIKGLSFASKILNTSSKINPLVKALGKTAVTATTSRYIENTMEAAGTVEEYKSNYIAEWNKEHPNQQMEADDIAVMNKNAGEAGLKNWYANSYMLAIDALQMSMLFRPVNKVAKKASTISKAAASEELKEAGIKGIANALATETTEQAAKQAAKSIAKEAAEKTVKDNILEFGGKVAAGTKSVYKAATSDVGKKVFGVITQGAGEAAEEGYQFLSSKASIEAQKNETHFATELLGQANKHASDPELYTSMFFGAFGGAMLGSVGPALVDGYKIGKSGFMGEKSPQDLMKDEIAGKRALAMNNFGAFHVMEKVRLNDLFNEHYAKGVSEDLITVMQQQRDLAEKSGEYEQSELDYLDENIQFAKDLEKKYDEIKINKKMPNDIKNNLMHIYGSMKSFETSAKKINEEYENIAQTEEEKIFSKQVMLNELKKQLKKC